MNWDIVHKCATCAVASTSALALGGGAGYLSNYPTKSYKIQDISPFWSANDMSGDGLRLVKGLMERHKGEDGKGKWDWNKDQLDGGLKRIRDSIKGSKGSQQSKKVRKANDIDTIKKISGLENIFSDLESYCNGKRDKRINIRSSRTLSGYLNFCWNTDSNNSSSSQDSLE